jgi:hypothetical protein
MRSTVVALVLSLVVGSAFASTTDSQTVFFDGSQTQEVLNLKAEKTRTEYRDERVARTCYRTVVAGYRTVCRRPPPPQPQQCWREAVYRTVPYTCYETIRVPYEVFEYHVDANVTINYSALPEGLVAAENITATLNGDLLSIRSNGSKRLIVELQSFPKTVSREGQTLVINATANLAFHGAQAVSAALKLDQMKVTKSQVTYNLGALENLGIRHTLKIVENPLVGGSTVLFNQPLDLTGTQRGSVTEMLIDFQTVLGRTLSKGRYDITVGASYPLSGTVLNAAEVGELSVEKTIRYSLR